MYNEVLLEWILGMFIFSGLLQMGIQFRDEIKSQGKRVTLTLLYTHQSRGSLTIMASPLDLGRGFLIFGLFGAGAHSPKSCNYTPGKPILCTLR